MCFFYALSREAQAVRNRYQLKTSDDYQPFFYCSGFEFPRLPVITSEQPEALQLYSWGLVPAWVATAQQAQEIRAHTLNARSETVFDKPSFRHAIARQRCLVPADGFYEWRLFQGKKYPYFIYLKDRSIFSLAGIWERWLDKTTGEVLPSFSILTTEANSLLAEIHNTKLRMPVILPPAAEQEWLQQDLGREALQALLRPLASDLMQAHPISRLITSSSGPRDVPAVQQPFCYPELES